MQRGQDDFFKALGCTRTEFCAVVARQLREGGPQMTQDERAELLEMESQDARGCLPPSRAAGLKILRLRAVLAIQDSGERQAAWVALCRVENLLN